MTTRLHGRQPDKYFNVRFQVKGVCVNEGYGWASEGMSASKAFMLMTELKEELKTGKGSGLLSDRQKAREQAGQEAKAERQKEERKAITYEQYFYTRYLSEIEKEKSKGAVRDEKSLHKNWILPCIGTMPITSIRELHVKKISRTIENAGKAPRTAQLALSFVRMVINHAIRGKYHTGPNPVSTLPRNSKPKLDNKRIRFFTHSEAEKLLGLLKEKSNEVHDMTLLALYCGFRAGEIFGLTWQYVDLANRQVTLTETKSGKDRTVPMTKAIEEMFEARKQGNRNELVFPDKKGCQRASMSKTFERTVKQMGLNEGVTDRKNKLVFHSCRHTCASWLVQSGASLLAVKEILGHSTIVLTERYSHLAPDGTRAALQIMEQAIQKSKTETNVQQLVNYN